MSDEELKDAYDKETCENIIGLRRRLEFDKTVMTAEEFEAFNARFLRLILSLQPHITIINIF